MRFLRAGWEGGLIVQFCRVWFSNLAVFVRREGGGIWLTLHTTLAQRRHSPTMSRAHLATFPRVIRVRSPLGRLSSRMTDLTLSGRTEPLSNISARVSMYSFSHRRVSLASWWRNGAKFTWNWRHVFDSA